MNFRLFKPKYNEQSDEQLIRLMTDNANENAFEELYHRYCKKLIWFGMRILENREFAEDIVHDTFVKIIDNPSIYNHSSKFSTWIYTLVKNACISKLRIETNRERLVKENYFQIDTTYISTNIDAEILKKGINAVFQELNDKEQLIFTLRFEQELSIKEIASISEIPEGSVKSCIYYMLKKITPQLQSYK